MKKLTLILASALFVATTATVSAQRIEEVSGNGKMLKNQKSLLVEYDFKDVEMGKEGKETDYLEKKRKALNEKEAGKGDSFVSNWNEAKATKYPEKFEALFNKEMEGKMTVSRDAKDAKYKIILKVLTLYPGYNIGVSKWPAYITVEYTIVETAHPDKVLCKLTNEKVPGSQFMGGDYDATQRIVECFAKTAKNLAVWMDKQ